MSNKFILNADDFGMSYAFNRAILEGFNDGFLKSASLVANGEAYDDAIKRIIPNCNNQGGALGVGIHLNIIEGYSLCNDLSELTDDSGKFNNSWGKILLKSLNTKYDTFMEQVEKEFRTQIEKVQKDKHITHIDSHVHVHAIPKIFELVCRLAKEYGIPQIRTQFERPYIIPDIFIHLNKKYYINLIKLIILNIFTLINENKVKQYNLKTNDYLIGVTYTSLMNSLAVSCGLMAIDYENITVEALIHPCRYDDGTIDNHFVEFQITKNKKLKDKIEKLGYVITNYIENEQIENNHNAL